MEKRFARYIPLALFLTVIIVGFFAAPRVGPAWDEPDNIYAGGQYLKFFREHFNPAILTRRDTGASVFGDRIFTQEPTISRYPPVPNYVGTLFAVMGSGLGAGNKAPEIITAFHLASALFFAILVVTVYQFALLLELPVWAAGLAALGTFAYPTMFGHGMSDLKDVAQVSLFTLALYVLVRGSAGAKKISGKYLVSGAVIWGLAVATKFNAVYVPVIWGVWLILSDIFSRNFIKVFPGRIRQGAVVAVAGLLTAFAVWPYLWFDPVPRAIEVIRYFTTVGQGYRVFWDGTLYQVGVGKSLWWYPGANILLSTPVLVLIAIAIGLAYLVREAASRTKTGRIRMVLLVWIVIPLLRAFLPRSAFYDGMRHFMEIIPAIMIAAAMGSLAFITFVKKRFPAFVIGAYVLVAASVGYMMYIDLVYFPYSAGYYNLFAADANARFDRDIEALSVREAVDYIHTTGSSARVWVPIGGHLSWYYLTQGDQYVYNSSDAQYIVLVNKSSHITRKDLEASIGGTYRLVHTITRDGADIAWVYRNRE